MEFLWYSTVKKYTYSSFKGLSMFSMHTENVHAVQNIHNAIYFQKCYNIPSILTDHFSFFFSFFFYIYLFLFYRYIWVVWEMLHTEPTCESTARAPRPYFKSMCAKCYTTALIDRIGFITTGRWSPSTYAEASYV